MSIEDILQVLDAAMAEADSRAEEVRASFAGAVGAKIGAAELEDVARGSRLVDRFLSDVDEALKQIFVAGLAYPDPELPDELGALAERAGRHGLASAVAHLTRLVVLVEAISEQRDLLVRHDFAQRAWDETQRFVAWLRMFRVEHDHLVVQGRLAAQSDGAVEQHRVTYPARTMSVWPLGMELDSGGRLVIFARDLDSDRVVLLRDHLAEFDPDSPLTSRVISRLFQDSLVLGDVLSNVIHLEDHPVVTRARALLFRPAFQAIPKLRPVGDHFNPPALPRMPLKPSGLPSPVVSDGPARLTVRARLDGGALIVETLAGGLVPLSTPSGTLRLNLTKLMIREGAASIELDAVLLPRDEELLILNVTTPLDGVTFPAYDPSLFKIANTVLARAAEATAAEALSHAPIKAAWLRCAAYLPGGVSPDQLDDLIGQLDALKAVTLADHYLLELSRYFIGAEAEPDGLEFTLRRTLQLAALPDGAAVDLGALAHVLGLPERATSPVDIRLIDGDAIYKAVWLAFERDLIEALEVELDAVYKARYEGELKDPTPGDVCARALMMAIFERLVQDEDVPAETRPSTQFLSAFIADLNPTGVRKKTLMPEPMELFWYGDTLAVLTAGERLGSPVAKLGLPAEAISRACVDALHAWRTASGPPPAAVVERAAEAILLAVSSGVKGLVLT